MILLSANALQGVSYFKQVTEIRFEVISLRRKIRKSTNWFLKL